MPRRNPWSWPASRCRPWRAPHFVWFVRDSLARVLCGEAPTCTALEQGGLRITTTLDWRIQQIAEKWVQAGGARTPSRQPRRCGAAARRALHVVDGQPAHQERLERCARGDRLPDGRDPGLRGLSELLRDAEGQQEAPAPVRRAQRRLAPAGSAFKPFNYATGINDGRHDRVDHVHGRHHRLRRRLHAHRLRSARARPGAAAQGAPVLAQHPVGQGALDERPAARLRHGQGVRHEVPEQEARGRPVDGAGHPRGPSARPHDRLCHAGQQGHLPGPRGHPERSGTRGGDDVIPPYETPKGTGVVSPQAAYIVTDILAGNTVPAINPVWGAMEITTPGGEHRPATLKTGTNNDAKDLSAYGYIAPPTRQGRADGEYALVVGVWMGNSDATPVSSPAAPIFSIDVAAPLWQAVMKRGHPQVGRERLPATRTASPAPRSTRSPASSPPSGRGARWTRSSSRAPRPTMTRTSVASTSSRGLTAATTAGTTVARASRRRRASWRSVARSRTRRAGRTRTRAGSPRARRGPGVSGGPKAHHDGLLLRAELPALRPQLGCAVRAHEGMRRGTLRRPPALSPSAFPSLLPSEGPVDTAAPTAGNASDPQADQEAQAAQDPQADPGGHRAAHAGAAADRAAVQRGPLTAGSGASVRG